MKEARNIVILVLVLLFIFVGVGVAISRLNKKTESQGKKADAGFIQQIFGGLTSGLGNSSGAKTSPTPTPAGKLVVTNTSTDENGAPTYTFQTTTATPAPTKAVMTTGKTKSIPSTGANPAIVLIALMGLASGLYLHRKA